MNGCFVNFFKYFWDFISYYHQLAKQPIEKQKHFKDLTCASFFFFPLGKIFVFKVLLNGMMFHSSFLLLMAGSYLYAQ